MHNLFQNVTFSKTCMHCLYIVIKVGYCYTGFIRIYYKYNKLLFKEEQRFFVRRCSEAYFFGTWLKQITWMMIVIENIFIELIRLFFLYWLYYPLRIKCRIEMHSTLYWYLSITAKTNLLKTYAKNIFFSHSNIAPLQQFNSFNDCSSESVDFEKIWTLFRARGTIELTN